MYLADDKKCGDMDSHCALYLWLQNAKPSEVSENNHGPKNIKLNFENFLNISPVCLIDRR